MPICFLSAMIGPPFLFIFAALRPLSNWLRFKPLGILYARLLYVPTILVPVEAHSAVEFRHQAKL